MALDNILIENIEQVNVEFEDIFFDTDQDEIQDPNDLTLVKEIASYLIQHPDYFILIQGYTDKSGTATYNLDLSERRANNIKNKLLSSGVTEKQIVTLGRGIHESKSLRKENILDRKVSFVIYK